MNRTLFLVVMIACLVAPAFAQSQDVPKYEVAAEFTTFERDDITGRRTEPGIGGRFTYNLNRVFALEAAGYFFPRRCFQCRNGGRITEGFGGVKAGFFGRNDASASFPRFLSLVPLSNQINMMPQRAIRYNINTYEYNQNL